MYQDMMDTIGFVGKYDPEVSAAMEKELERQRRNLELIASENIVSPAVMAAMGSVLTNKYAEGLPHKRYYGGCEYVDVVEEIAIDRAKKLFGAKFANVQPHSGAQANTAVYFALLQPGDTVLGMSLAHGGHLTHGSPVNISGKYFNFVSYGLGDDETIDYDKVATLAKEHKPKMIVAGASAYPRIIDFPKLAEIAKSVGAYLMVDMAHIAGLVAAGVHPSPVPYADITTTTTHKTLRGPRGGLILCNDEELAKKIKRNYHVEPVVHLTCLHYNKAEIDEFAKILTAEGIQNVLALRGDRTPNLTEKEDFAHASDLITYLKPKGDFCFLGACYPECHPESTNKIDEIHHLKEKVNAGAEILLSQLFFDNTQFYRFVEDCRIADINVPIVPGIMPVINAAQIKRMITMCGASFPERFQRIIHKFEDNKAALFDAGMSYALSQIIDLLANDTDGIHLYTMNNPVVARKICEGIQNII